MQMYPRIKVTLLTIEGHFGPPLIEWLSRELEVPKVRGAVECIVVLT